MRPERNSGGQTCYYSSPPRQAFEVCKTISLKAVPLACFQESLHNQSQLGLSVIACRPSNKLSRHGKEREHSDKTEPF